MNIKLRLIAFNTLSVLVPVLLTILSTFLYYEISLESSSRNVDLRNYQEISRIQASIVSEQIKIAKDQPDSFLNAAVQEKLSTRVKMLMGNIVILQNDQTLFNSSDLSNIEIDKCLDIIKSGSLNPYISINDVLHDVKGISLRYNNGKSGFVLFLFPFGQTSLDLRNTALFAVIVFVISYVGVNLYVTTMLTTRIINPILNLKETVAQISAGDLRTEVIPKGDLEIRELCNAIERMRLRLAQSVEEKMRYDENRKILITSISHDLKTPITSIKGYVEGIVDGVANTPEKVDTYLKTIVAKTVQLNHLIDDLLLYSKLDLRQIPFNFERTDIKAYFEDCVSEFAPEMEKHHIHLTLLDLLHAEPTAPDFGKQDPVYVYLDRERMRRVISNIFANARKYMDKETGTLHVALKANAQSVLIEMKDNGKGIEAEALPHIFNRFYRAESAKGFSDGSGLGLSIARQIVEGHDGRIWATSVLGEGTSIVISLKKD